MLSPVFLSSLLVGYAAAAPSASGGGVLTDPTTFNSHHFDYLIVGGGNAGLPLAVRLSENPSVTVGVLEAGPIHLNDSLVDTPIFLGQALNNPAYDWYFMTAPQKNLNNRQIAVPRGKMLGGTSALNFMAWHRSSRAEYDAWSDIADAGRTWSWDGLLPYFKKSEAVIASSPGAYPGITGSTLADDSNGRSGPIDVGFNNFHTDVDGAMLEGLKTLGIDVNLTPDNGDNSGAFDGPRSIEDKSGNRSYAVNAYYLPAQRRPNLVVLTGAQVTKITLDSSGGSVRATGVDYVSNGQNYHVEATKEVILSAGSIQTPQLLELSGIGNPRILGPLGIECLINNTNVGENLQEHAAITPQFLLTDEAAKNLVVLSTFASNATFREQQRQLYVNNHTGIFTYGLPLLAFVPASLVIPETKLLELYADLAVDISRSNLSAYQQLRAHRQLFQLIDNQVPQAEFLPFPGGLAPGALPSPSITLAAFVSKPFSRGSVHINSSDPLAYPVIDPNYLSISWDLKFMIALLQSMLRVARTEPLRSILKAPVGLSWNATDREAEQFIRANMLAEYHPIGTASLGPRHTGGVVGDDLKVWGTSNLRVVDASIIPLHITGHPQATIYAIAEKAADIISGHR